MQFVCKDKNLLSNKNAQKMKNTIYTILILLFISVCAGARPVRPGMTTFTQPDGTTFQGICRGDEFYRIKTTAEGCAIIQDEEGWWCYATYDMEGQMQNTGHRIGAKVSSSILNQARNIPYEVLSYKAEIKRAVMQSKAPSLQLLGANTSGQEAQKRHGIVILAEYSDVSFQHTREDFVNLLTMEGYCRNGATGSAMEYFNDQFKGKFDFSFDVSEIVTLTKRRAYYGANDGYGNDVRPAEMVQEACELAAASGIDFSLYDDDNDGEVDNVFVFFAGCDEAEYPSQSDLIWSHAWYVKTGAGINLTLNGKVIDRYACTAELMAIGQQNLLAGIGTFCHEYSHTFGLPDLYDTDYDTGGWAGGTWTWTALMDGGNMNNDNNTPPYYNAVEREILGLGEAITITANGSYTLEPIGKGGKFYRLDTDNKGEYYLIENRGTSGWDAYIGGSGLLVYHIDKTASHMSRWNKQNSVNALQSHQCADLIEADARSDKFTSSYDYATRIQSIKGIFFPYSTTNSLTFDSTPGLSWWSGKKGDVIITDIQRNGESITFCVSGFPGETPPVAANIRTEAFMDAAIIRFESDRVYEGEATVAWGRTGQETETVKVAPYEPGKYSLTLEGLAAGNKTYTASIYFEIEDVKGEAKTTSFMTSRKAPVEWPYIYLGKGNANSNGTYDKGTRVALRVYNAAEAQMIEWTFNRKGIKSEGDGYYTLTENGILKAYIYWEDGSVDILEKTININE